LLRHFGSLKRLGQATPEEITEVPGIGRRTAEAVLAALQSDAEKPQASGAGSGTFPAGGAGRTKSGATRARVGLPAPAPVRAAEAAAQPASGESAAAAPAAEARPNVAESSPASANSRPGTLVDPDDHGKVAAADDAGRDIRSSGDTGSGNGPDLRRP
jgi:excinuclease ABC subunit C